MVEFNPALQSRRQGLSWDKETKVRVSEIREDLKTAGYPMSNKELFMLFLGIGWKHQLNPGVPPRTTDSARLSELTAQDFGLFNAIAMSHTESFEVLSSRDAVLDVVEGFAAGGLRKAAEILDNSQSLITALRTDFWPVIDKWEPSVISQPEEN